MGAGGLPFAMLMQLGMAFMTNDVIAIHGLRSAAVASGLVWYAALTSAVALGFAINLKRKRRSRWWSTLSPLSIVGWVVIASLPAARADVHGFDVLQPAADDANPS